MVLGVAGAVLFALPQLDMAASGAYYGADGFAWRTSALANFFHNLVHPVSLVLAGCFTALIGYQAARQRGVQMPLFLLLALLVGPGLITNTLLKDNWGRARPMQITEFGGTQQFSPPLLISDQCDHNCSFVGGDAAFGFWFHSFGYVVPRRRRLIFLGGVGVGLGYSWLRVGMGAHFLSDVFFAGIVVLLSSALCYASLYGRSQLKARWAEFLGGK